MNVFLADIEERIKDWLGKESNQGKTFSLLFIAKIIDPKAKIGYTEFEMILRKMEIEGTLYHNVEDDSWCLFPHDMGFVQCSLSKNSSGEGLINMPDGRKFKLEGKDTDTILDGDLVVVKPTSKRSGNRMIAEFVKTVKRKNGLVAVEVMHGIDSVILKPISTTLGLPIVLDKVDLGDLKDQERLLVHIDQPTDGVFKAELIKRINPDEDYLPLTSAVDTEDYAMEVYKSNVERLKAEYEYEDYVVRGTLKVNKYGEGIVEVDKKIYYIKKENLGDALNGDIVDIRPSKLKSHGRTISTVDEVVERKDGLVAVEVVSDKKGEYSIVPVSYSLKHKLVLPEGFDKPLVCGDRFLAKIGLHTDGNKYEVEFVRGLGHKDDPGADIRLIAAEYGIEEVFTDDQMTEANAMPSHVLEKEKIGRQDFTKKKVFTIDGARAKDRDDALSIETLDNGNYLIGVHIADVTHYIKPGMALWDAIMERATSVYMADTVIPMLPHILSNGILSLNPGVERLTLSCLIEMTPDGDVVNYDFDECVIKSEMAMVYDEVNEILEENKVPKGYEDFTSELRTLHDLSKKLSKKKDARGAVNFDDLEGDTEIQYDEQGKPIEFVTKGQRSAETLIENFMLLAGTCYAEYMMVPTTLRVHEAPDPDALEESIDKLKKLGVKVTSVSDILNGASLTKIINSIKDQDLKSLAAKIILFGMKRARIDIDELLGHYALALRKIGRFTSPMRRAEDAIGHWQLKKQKYGLFDYDNFEEEIQNDAVWISKEAEHINTKQYNADQAEQAAVHLRMVDCIQPHIGEYFNAKVTYVNDDGIFVKLGNGVIGKIDPYDYHNEYLLYDDSTMTYVGRTSGVKIGVGTELRVQALDTHREFRTINFGVSKEEGKKLIKKRAA